MGGTPKKNDEPHVQRRLPGRHIHDVKYRPLEPAIDQTEEVY